MSSLLLGLFRSPASSRRRSKEKATPAAELVEKPYEGVELKPLSLTPRAALEDDDLITGGPGPPVQSPVKSALPGTRVTVPEVAAATPRSSPSPVPSPGTPAPPRAVWHQSVESQFVLRYLSASADGGVDITPLIRTGFLLCKLLSAAIPGSLDDRAINTGSSSSSSSSSSAAGSPRSGGGGEGGGGGAATAAVATGGAPAGASWADMVASAAAAASAQAAAPRGGLTAEEAVENLQLCRSCAVAQGCDVAGIDVHALQAAEADAVTTDFVLEVLRQSVVCALPPTQRHWLAPPPQPVPAAARVAAGSRAKAGGAASAGRSGCAAAAPAGPLASAAQAEAPGAAAGTAAARRAVAGLQHWAAQRLAAASGTAAAGGAAAGASAAESSTGGAGMQEREQQAAAAVLADPDAWIRLAATALTPRVSAPGDAVAARAQLSATAATAVSTGAEGDVDADADDDDDARWAAAAAALDKALRAALPAPPGGAAAPALPPLQPEYLRSTHPGLRSVLLAHALLASSVAAAAAASAAAAAVHSEGSSMPTVVEGQVLQDSGAYHAEQAGRQEVGDEHGTAHQEPKRLAVDAGPLGLSDGGSCGGSSGASPSATAAAAAAAAAAVAVMQTPPASPPPPLPGDARQRQISSSGGGGWGGGTQLRGARSLGPPPDMLSEHNKLVAWEHQQRELRRQQRSMGSGAGADGGGGGEGAADGAGGGAGGGGVGLARAGSRSGSRSELWSGEAEDLEGDSQEERVLRLWLNSLDPARLHVGSLFEREVATGWPLLLALDAIQPGCVAWADTFRPPFKEKLHKILSVQNCNQVVALCGPRHLGLPHLVNIGGLDLALGQRRATLSLVFQMMHHHTGMMLGLLAPPPPPTKPTAATTTTNTTATSVRATDAAAAAAAAASAKATAPSASPTSQPPPAAGTAGAAGTAAPAAGAAVPEPRQHHHGHHRPLEVEKAVIAWANAKLTEAAANAAATAASAGAAAATDGKAGGQEVAAAAAAAAALAAPQAPFTPLSGFSDPRLAEGQVLLQLLAAVSPRAVSTKYVLSGRNPGERESNAKYLLSCARKVGCVIYLGWEDVMAARPRLLLLLLASFMALDRRRDAAAAAAAAAAGGAGGAAAGAAAGGTGGAAAAAAAAGLSK
ncbi:hypothetical protein HYH02_002028 [Chlamydomonas schloesseri]|uniref:Calponin-homology (CH) domain-containing protein n=1 Tax=Chlamydomonas schloesseri TaxID=2026947 RepID=A0A835WUE0_9CHLO|nr:hypothetical protein HYH02_002028 [Chlamydomonas schloesseri]|eukprot:KAG2453821.1 hypothetical protein HYH02_002028 [Chlamydomonas schloesseri]